MPIAISTVLSSPITQRMAEAIAQDMAKRSNVYNQLEVPPQHISCVERSKLTYDKQHDKFGIAGHYARSGRLPSEDEWTAHGPEGGVSEKLSPRSGTSSHDTREDAREDPWVVGRAWSRVNLHRTNYKQTESAQDRSGGLSYPSGYSEQGKGYHDAQYQQGRGKQHGDRGAESPALQAWQKAHHVWVADSERSGDWPRFNDVTSQRAQAYDDVHRTQSVGALQPPGQAHTHIWARALEEAGPYSGMMEAAWLARERSQRGHPHHNPPRNMVALHASLVGGEVPADEDGPTKKPTKKQKKAKKLYNTRERTAQRSAPLVKSAYRIKDNRTGGYLSSSPAAEWRAFAR